MTKQEELDLIRNNCFYLVQELSKISMNLPSNHGYFDIKWYSGVTTDVVRSTYTKIDLQFISNVSVYKENTYPIITISEHHLKDDLDTVINLWKKFYKLILKNMTLGKKVPTKIVKPGCVVLFVKPIGLYMTEGVTQEDLQEND